MNIKNFIQLAKTSVAYNDQTKAKFHREAAQVLKSLALKLGFQSKDYDLRHNMAGIAVSGEITLHSDNLYVQFFQSALGPNCGFMWRTCKSRRDYTGGPNQWLRWEDLTDLDKVAATMKPRCQRCRNDLSKAGFCVENICHFSTHKQNCGLGWTGHVSYKSWTQCQC